MSNGDKQVSTPQSESTSKEQITLPCNKNVTVQYAVGKYPLRPRRERSRPASVPVKERLHTYTVFDTIFLICSAFVTILNVGMNICLSVKYCIDGDETSGILTGSLVALTILVKCILNIKWSFQSGVTSLLRGVKILLSITGFEFLFRSAEGIWHGMQCMKYEKNQSDNQHSSFFKVSAILSEIRYLGLCEAAVLCVPELILQLTIYNQRNHDSQTKSNISCWQKGTLVVSAVCLAWHTSAFLPLRDEAGGKHLIKNIRAAVKFLAVLLSIISRLLAVYLFTAVFYWWSVVLCTVHWVMTSVWVFFLMKRNLTKDFIQSAAIGMLYVMAFVDTDRGNLRGRYACYNLLYFIENIYLMVHSVLQRGFSSEEYVTHAYRITVLHMTAFCTSLYLICVYLRWLHPRKTTADTYPIDVRSEPEDYRRCYVTRD